MNHYLKDFFMRIKTGPACSNLESQDGTTQRSTGWLAWWIILAAAAIFPMQVQSATVQLTPAPSGSLKLCTGPSLCGATSFYSAYPNGSIAGVAATPTGLGSAKSTSSSQAKVQLSGSVVPVSTIFDTSNTIQLIGGLGLFGWYVQGPASSSTILTAGCGAVGNNLSPSQWYVPNPLQCVGSNQLFSSPNSTTVSQIWQLGPYLALYQTAISGPIANQTYTFNLSSLTGVVSYQAGNSGTTVQSCPSGFGASVSGVCSNVIAGPNGLSITVKSAAQLVPVGGTQIGIPLLPDGSSAMSSSVAVNYSQNMRSTQSLSVQLTCSSIQTQNCVLTGPADTRAYQVQYSAPATGNTWQSLIISGVNANTAYCTPLCHVDQNVNAGQSGTLQMRVNVLPAITHSGTLPIGTTYTGTFTITSILGW